MQRRALIALFPIAAFLAGCPSEKEDAMTAGEALQALDEASISSQAASLTSGTVEIATNFTIGQAVEKAAGELRSFIESQLPCAEIDLNVGKLDVTYGAKEGNCTYHGNTYSGQHTIEVERADDGDVLVSHRWTDLSNTKVKVSGTAQVTWSFKDKERNVKHDLTWTRIRDGRTGKGSGDRTQKALDGKILTGISIDGARAWEGERGKWDLAINNVEMRWSDPVPQSGSYVLATPKGKSATLAFGRVDDDTIRVTLSSGDNKFGFNVSKLGTIKED